MKLTFSELVKIEYRRQGLTVEKLAERLGTSKQNLNQKLLRDNFTCRDMEKIADALGCDLVIDIVKKP